MLCFLKFFSDHLCICNKGSDSKIIPMYSTNIILYSGYHCGDFCWNHMCLSRSAFISSEDTFGYPCLFTGILDVSPR